MPAAHCKPARVCKSTLLPPASRYTRRLIPPPPVPSLHHSYKMEAKRHTYVTPTSYLQLLDCFRGLLARQQQAVTAQRRRYEVGLEKLAGTEEQVRGEEGE